MPNLQNHVCSCWNDMGIILEINKNLKFKFQDVYTHAEEMAILAKEIQKKNQNKFCYLPFCHTIEAEALGACIHFGDAYGGPRAQGCACSRIEELLCLPEINFTKGRIKQALEACNVLHNEGFDVALMISGPFTILNAFIGLGQILRGWRKSPGLMGTIFDHIGKQLIHYIHAAMSVGVTLFCYGDPTGGDDIIGPKWSEIISGRFTVPFLRSAEKILDGGTLMHLCPKTSLSLTELGFAAWRDIPLPNVLRYEEACLAVRKDAHFVGEVCIHNAQMPLYGGKIRSIDLLGEEEARHEG